MTARLLVRLRRCGFIAPALVAAVACGVGAKRTGAAAGNDAAADGSDDATFGEGGSGLATLEDSGVASSPEGGARPILDDGAPSDAASSQPGVVEANFSQADSPTATSCPDAS